jgi:DNA-directed RNA polymerase subunit RPC12/RpoP
MESDNASVSFNCKKCGTKLSWADDAVDATSIDCTNCGFHFGTYADLRRASLEALRDKIVPAFKEGIKRR